MGWYWRDTTARLIRTFQSLKVWICVTFVSLGNQAANSTFIIWHFLEQDNKIEMVDGSFVEFCVQKQQKEVRRQNARTGLSFHQDFCGVLLFVHNPNPGCCTYVRLSSYCTSNKHTADSTLTPHKRQSSTEKHFNFMHKIPIFLLFVVDHSDSYPHIDPQPWFTSCQHFSASRSPNISFYA